MLFGPMPIAEASSRQKSLQNKRVLSIDLAAIVAGSGIRGQFEEKFKALIKDIEDEVCLDRDLALCSAPYAVRLTLHTGTECDLLHRRTPYVPVGIFVLPTRTADPLAPDMLFNLGKAEGSVDAGQMIKPALARGLQLVGATTRTSPSHYSPYLA